MTAEHDVTLVPGAAETVLDVTARASLPDEVPPAPWRCRCDALLWTARATDAAREALEPAVTRQGTPIAVIGGFIRYSETPVGVYDEVLGAVILATRRGVRASVPFLAVDSAPSVLGGRANWSLPKTRAQFTGTPEAGAMSATHERWSLRAGAHSLPRGVRASSGAQLVQAWPDGIVRGSRLQQRGTAKPALVRVEARSDHQLARWLRPGLHAGVVLRDALLALEPAGVRP